MTGRTRRSQGAGDGQALFRSLFDSAPDAIVLVSAQGTITLINPQGEKLFGYRQAELVGQPIEKLLPERHRAQHVGHRSRYFERPHVRPMGAGVELQGRRRDGSEFPVDIMLSPMTRDGDGSVIAIVRDVTDRMRVEQALREKNVELEKANLTKDRFLASMSHELRTPLNAIIGFTGTLLMKLPGPLTGDQEKQLGTVQSSAKHLLSLINDLLDLAKVESGKVVLELRPADCRAILEEVAATLRPQAEAKGLKFIVDLPQREVVVETDRRAVSQILLNLAGNAVKFTDSGFVRVALTERNTTQLRTIEIHIEDSGRGIRSEDQPRLFDAFTQIEGTIGRAQGGAGLGLHLSRKLADLLGGLITFRSEHGKGSTFTLALPER